jgi:hypothetical protein
MYLLKVTSEITARTIERPVLSAIVDPFRDIIGLPPRPPSGFKPDIDDTTIDTIIDRTGDGIGPLAISTACNHLYCYAARYDDGKSAVAVIAGDCALAPIADGRLQHDISLINRLTLHHGPISSHSLTTVVTPRSNRGFLASWVLHHAQTEILQTLANTPDALGTENPAPIAPIRVRLRGWLSFENSLPTCVIEGDQRAIRMRIIWGKDYSSEEVVRLL